ncbi:MAG TPA: repressor LexA, partial [Planctomycetaceae bacterium]|nr:repressor LexA [Planctomycetaceae bacterium]
MTLTDSLTSRQRDVFEFIRGQIRTRGYGPTVREIGEAFDIKSPNGVMCHLKALERKGLIIRSPNKSRAIELSDEFKESQGLPFLGQVSSGLTELDADVGGQLCWEEL